MNEQADQWFYLDGGESSGPITATEIRDSVHSGALDEDVMIWRAGMADWMPIRSVPDLANAHYTTPPPPPKAIRGNSGRPALNVPQPIRITGKSIYLAEGFHLPVSHCVCCGEPATTQTKRKFAYTPDAIWIAVIAPLLLLILWICLRRRRLLRFGLCERHTAVTRTKNLILWISGSLFWICGILALIISADGRAAVLGLVSLLAFITWVFLCHTARPLKILSFHNGYIKLAGVSPSLLNILKY